MQSLRNGTQLGAYTLIQLIARGGMGEVYEAHEVNLQRRVALKVIAPRDPDEHDREELIHRFLQEARTLARVNHPNIVTIYAIDNMGDVPFIAMEYIEGVSFKELLKEFVLTAEAAAPLFVQMLEGVRCLHENRIIHRDLKPHNILLRPDGQIKVLDFGIAKHAGAGEYTQVGVVVGTLPYMAPELKSGVPASPQSDFWSLGAIFYECLIGKPLILAMRDSNGLKEVPYPSDTRVPIEMRAIIQKMCAPRPADRYVSAVQAIEELHKFQQNRPQPTPEIWAGLAQKINSISETRNKKHAIGEITGDVKMATPVPSSPPIPKIAPIEVALGHVEPNPASQRTGPHPTYKRKTKKAIKYLSSEYALGGAALVLLLAMFLFWPKQEMVELPPQPVTQQPPVAPPVVFRPPKEVLELKEPANGQTLWLLPNAIPTLSWSAELIPNEYEIQIARDIEFKNLVVQEPVSGRSYRPARVLPDGKYHWRLIALKDGEKTPEPNPFTIVLLTPVELVSPADQSQLTTKLKKSQEVDLSWVCKRFPATYKIEISDSSTFKETVADQTTKDCAWKDVKLDAGTYYWRVSVKANSEAQDLWSDAHRFTLNAQAESAPLAKVKLVTKTKLLTLEFKPAARDVASEEKVVANPPSLEWQSVKGAQRYLIQFSGVKGFTTLLSEEITKTPKFQWRGVAPGRVFWRVAALGANGVQGPFSEPSDLDVKLPAPALEPTYRFQVVGETGAPLVLEWPAIPFAQKYLVQMGKKRDLANASPKVVDTPQLKVNPDAGHFFIRVATVDASGEVTSDFSKPASVDVEATAALETPGIITPKPGMKVAVRGSKISIVFTWTLIEGANSYSVEIASDKDFQHILQSRKSRDTTLVLKQAEFNGMIFWRVRARGAKGVSAWSDAGFFEIN